MNATPLIIFQMLGCEDRKIGVLHAASVVRICFFAFGVKKR